MERESFVFYKSFAEALNALDKETRADCYDAIVNYGLYGIEPELEGLPAVIFTLVKPQLDANNKKYQNGKKGAEFGKLGGRPKKDGDIIENPIGVNKKTPNVNVNDNENVNVNVNVNDKGVDFQQVVNLYNNTCVSFPKITKLSDSRKKAISARLKKYSLDDLGKAFEMAEQSDFLKGGNNRNWSANFDWMMNDTNLAKILDGNYINKKHSKIDIDNNFRNFLEENQVVDWSANGTVS